MLGTIRTLMDQKGYGFINGNDGKEYFFHRDDFVGFWPDLITESQADSQLQLDFTAAKTPKGLRAQNVSIANWPNAAAKEIK